MASGLCVAPLKPPVKIECSCFCWGGFCPGPNGGDPFLLLFHGAALACGRGSELRGGGREPPLRAPGQRRTFVARARLAQAARVERPIAGEKPLVEGGWGVGGPR